jgi:hypothetical protein
MDSWVMSDSLCVGGSRRATSLEEPSETDLVKGMSGHFEAL